MTYDDCKKQVAEKHGFETWEDMQSMLFVWQMSDLYTEAAEMYMQAKANEAVKEDREKLLADHGPFYILWLEKHIDADLVKSRIRSTPLPYPDEQ